MKKILYIDMDNVLVDFPTGIERIEERQRIEYEDRLDEVPHIFSKMDPIPGAIEAFHELAELFDTYILSTAPWHNPSAWHDKVVWVQHHLGEPAYKRLILSHNKHLNHGHFLIDDRTKNGAGQFTGEFIHFGQAKFPDWETVRRYLRDKC